MITQDSNLKTILILCTGNSCRSQIMHGYMQHFFGKRAVVYSAGVETHGVNTMAIEVMKEDGIDISHHTSNHVDEYTEVDFNLLVTVCDHANEVCPVFPAKTKKIHHSFTDPAKATGSEEEILDEFRRVRDEIKNYSQQLSKRILE